MPAIYRLKHSFTSGELSPSMNMRVDLNRYRNGCYKLRNMVCKTQGPVARRSGTRFIYDLNSIGMDTMTGEVRLVPFIFDETQAYVMVFYRHIDGSARVVFGANNGLVVYPDPPPTECPEGITIDPPPAAGDIVSLKLPAEWDIKNFDWAQSADEMYFAQSGLNPHIIKRHSHDCWELISVTFTDQPDDWSDENGWPEVVTFHQQRLVFGANRIRRQTIWMSMAGDFSSFHVDNANLTDDMAVTFTLDSGTQNKIQWIASGRALYVGTLGDEWTVTGSTQPALTPKNILAQRQTNIGSERLKPQVINFTTLFLAAHGRSVNEFVYDYAYDGFKSNDLTVLAPHMTDDYSIVDWAFQQTPDNIVWCVREDGAIIALTYQRQHKVVGWHQHTTVGSFRSVAVIPGDTREDEVWFIVQRNIGVETKFYVEKMETTFYGNEAADGYFMDAFSEYNGPPITKLSGLDYLEGMLVDVLADGTVHPQKLVNNGEIALNAEYSHVIVGLGYVSEVWPLLDMVPSNDGVSVTREQRILYLNIDFYNSLGVFIGRYDSEDGEYEEERAFRVPSDLTGQPVPLYTGVVSYDFPRGYDREIRYFIRQKQPLPLTVRGVVDIIEVNE